MSCLQQHKESDVSVSENEESHVFADIMTLKVKTTKKFAIDQSTSYQTLFLNVYYDNKEKKRYLTYQDGEGNCIQFYGFDSEVLERKICFSKQGPNSVRKLTGYKVINFDSIYVIDKSSKTLALFNGQGVKKENYRLLLGSETNQTSTAWAFSPTSFLLIENDSIYLPAHPNRSPYYLGSPFVAVDLKSGNYEYIGKYTDYYSDPNDEWNENIFGGFFSHSYNSKTKNMIFSFQGDPYIYTGHPRNPLRQKFLARSEKFYGAKPPANKALSSAEHFLSIDSYVYILYDSYRDLYYRVASHSTDLLKTDLTKNKSEDKIMSIIILDASFEKVGEVYLPPNRYFFRTMFVEKEGLYISTAHYANPNLKEDYIEFDVFEPQTLLNHE